MFNNVEILVKFVNQRNRSGNVQLSDIFIPEAIPASETLLSTLTIALRLFPWATTSTLLPDFIEGTIVSFQKGRTRSIVVLRL